MTRLLLFPIIFLFFLNIFLASALAKDFEESLKKAQALDGNGFLDESLEIWKELSTTTTNSNLDIYIALKLGATYLKLKQFQKSIDTLKAISEGNPESFDANFHFANSLSATKNFSAAIKAYAKTTTLKPREGLSYVGLGLSFFGIGDSKKAIEAILKANLLFKEKKNIAWHRDTRVMISQIRNFSKFPPHFSNLWLNNNLKVIQDTYEKAIFNSNQYLSPSSTYNKLQ
jgi:tetratricopeptide (TPR) repeat protein